MTSPRPPRTLTAGVGAAAALVSDLAVPLPPGHPLMHGSLQLRLQVQEDTVVAADPVPGWLHRGAEKLFEVRDYRQVLSLANRHDWLGSFSGELGVALVAEHLLGLDPPERALWARALVAELGRVGSHLVFLGQLPGHDVQPGGVIGPDPQAAHAAYLAREQVVRLLEELSGDRMHVTLARVGGLREDLPAGWLDRVEQVVAGVRGLLPAVTAPLHAPVVRERLRGLAVLSARDARAYAVTGPIARASGLDLDLRRDEPHAPYDELFGPGGPGRVVLRTEGDALARLEVLAEQVEVSLELVQACAHRLRVAPPGPIGVRLPKVLRVPEGEHYAAVETPLGVGGYWLVSTGDKTPWRLRIRSASFPHAAALAAILPGTPLAALPHAVASVPLVIGDLDR